MRSTRSTSSSLMRMPAEVGLGGRLLGRPAGRRAGRRVVGLSLGLTLFGLAACKTTEPKSAPATKAASRAEVIDGIPDELPPLPAAESAEEWAARAERDVEAFRSLRQRALNRNPDASSALDRRPGAAPPPALDAEPVHRAIEWNPQRTARNRAVTPDTTPPKTNAPTSSVAAPLARDTAPPIDVRPNPGAITRPAGTTVDPLDVQLVQLRQKLYQASIDSPQPIRELIAIAAMAIVDTDLDLPDGADRELTDEEDALLQELHTFFAGLGRQLGDGNAAEAIVAAVQDLQQTLAPEPRLDLPAAKLCWRIGGFGDFDPFDRTVFLAHSQQQVILYLEIEGFTSTRNEKQQWVTEVSQRLEIYSSDGIPVWDEPWQKAVDVTSKERRDFFTTQLITLPERLSVGRYHLKIHARDEASGAEAEESIQFEMVADPKLAAQVPQ